MATRSKSDTEVFYNKQYNVFKFFGLWEPPQYIARSWQMVYHAHFVLILFSGLVLFDICCLIEIIKNISSLDEIVKTFFIFATAINALAKFLSIKYKNNIAVDVFRQMHNRDFLPVNQHEDKIFFAALNLSRNNRNIYAGLSLTSLNLLLGTQYIIDNTQLPLPVYSPLNTDRTWNYIIMYIFQYIGAATCCITNICFDSMASSFFMYLKGQLKIISNRLEYIGRDPRESQEEINKQLLDCIRYYDKITHLTQTIENFVRIPMSTQILCSVMVLIANFYAIVILTDPGDYANLTKWFFYQLCMLLQIFILCYFANEVSLQSVELSHALYSAQWFSWNKVNRKLALLLMLRFDMPIRIHTINRCYSFNLAAFTSIVNSSYSYFALLQKMNT